MRPARSVVFLVAMCAAGTCAGVVAFAAGTAPAHIGDAFDVYADAYPVEPVFGLNSIGVPPRPTATRAHVSNAPVNAYARAAFIDLGVAESYTNKQGADAEVDTADTSAPSDRRYSADGVVLEAHVERSPRAESHAAGNRAAAAPVVIGSSNSDSYADGTAARLTAWTTATVHDVSAGVLNIGTARFDATASVTGRRGDGRASGVIAVDDATVAGIPVAITADGVQVDQTKVPAAQVATAAETVRQALTRSPYLEVRAIQPKAVAAADGTSATVNGGGVFIRMATGDPKNNYFTTVTLLGGSARAAIGGPVASPAPAVFRGDQLLPVPGGLDPGGPGSVLGSVLGPGRPPSGAAISNAARPNPAVVTASRTGRYRLPGAWRGWPWLLAIVVALLGGWQVLGWGALAPIRRRIERSIDAAGDRYLRG